MKKIELQYRKWLRAIFGCISLTAVAFIFEACYGVYEEHLPKNVEIRGKVTDTSDTPLRNIKVSIAGEQLADTTDSNGMYHINAVGQNQYDMRFESIEPDSVNLFLPKDTVINYVYGGGDVIFLNIRLDAR